MYAKKSLGQHFLISQKAIKSMVNSGEIKKGDTILEIGPGKGILTEEILKQADNVVAIEKDTELIPLLEEKFSEEIKSKKLILIQGDILSIDIENLKELKNPYKIIANIPYYITGAIIERFLSIKNQPVSMILLMQKEVAERIVSRDKKESVLSIAVKAYGEAKLIEKVPRGAFSPAPKVDSAIIAIKNISKKFFNDISEKDFFVFIKSIFGKKRKQIGGSISEFIGNKGIAIKSLEELNINPKSRPEEIDILMWKKIINTLAKYQ